jgi:protein-tyrosine phosphatase
MARICFVCLGNICRSPTAEGVMQSLVGESGLGNLISIDSAGTSGYHQGEAADSRSIEAARRRGYRLESRSRRFTASDFARFDYVVAMDRANLSGLEELAGTPGERSKLYLLRDFDKASPDGAEVPDPYYGGPGGFDRVLDICEAGCTGLLAHVRKQQGI